MLLVGCTTGPKRPETQSTTSTSMSIEGLAAAIAANAERSDHESDPKVRGELAAEAGRDAAACLAREPQAAACLYGRAIALGLEVKVHPLRAGELLKDMLTALDAAEAANPNYDQAGPSRVRALVLIRAPTWPLGPGDPEAGLAAARNSVTLQPQYPPNLLAMAEALAKTGDANGARESYARARDVAQSLPSTPQRDGWLREAGDALQRK
jgi:hypothetical protein